MSWLQDYQDTQYPPSVALKELDQFLQQLDRKGGPGSGHWGHAGRPGKRGGSLPANVAVSIAGGRTARQRQAEAAARGTVPEGPLTAEAAMKKIADLATISKREMHLMTRIGEMTDARTEAFRELRQNYEWGTDEYKKGSLAIDKEYPYSEIYEMREELRGLEEKRLEDQRQVLYVDNPSEVQVKMPFRRGRKDRVMEGVEAFRKLVGTGTMDNHTVTFINKKKGRSCCGYPRRIELTTDAGTLTALHEMGHAWEHTDRNVAMAARAFLGIRTAGERTRPLNSLQPGSGYDPDEMARPDKFTHPYMGKIYSSRVGGRPTEIISMGLQEMWKDPAGFAQADPEYFALIYNLCRGTAWRED